MGSNDKTGKNGNNTNGNGVTTDLPIEDLECFHTRRLARLTIRNMGGVIFDWLRQERRSRDDVTEMIRTSPFSSCNEFTVGISRPEDKNADKEDSIK